MMVLLLKLVMLLMNCGVLLYVSRVLYAHYRASYSMKSWSATFFFLSIGWLAIRGVFWLLSLLSKDKWSTMTFHMLYWLPNSFEFGAFACLPLFYLQLIYSGGNGMISGLVGSNDESGSDSGNFISNQQLATYLKPLYVVVVTLMCVVQISWAVIAGLSPCSSLSHGLGAVASNVAYGNTDDTHATADANAWAGGTDDAGDAGGMHAHRSAPSDLCFRTEYTGTAPRVAAGTLFLALGFVQHRYGYHVSETLAEVKYKMYFRFPIETLKVVNGFLATSFLSRGVYILATLLGVGGLPAIPLQNDKDIGIWVALFFTAWDYVPTVLLVLTLTRPIGDGPSHKQQERAVRRYHEYSDLENVDDEEGDGGDEESSNADAARNSSSHSSLSAATAAAAGAGARAREGNDISSLSKWLRKLLPKGFFFGGVDSPESKQSGAGGSGARIGSGTDKEWGHQMPQSHLHGNMTKDSASGTSTAAVPTATAAAIASSITKIHFGGSNSSKNSSNEGRNRDDEVIPIGSLERFSKPTTLEPSVRWLGAGSYNNGVQMQHTKSSPTRGSHLQPQPHSVNGRLQDNEYFQKKLGQSHGSDGTSSNEALSLSSQLRRASAGKGGPTNARTGASACSGMSLLHPDTPASWGSGIHTTSMSPSAGGLRLEGHASGLGFYGSTESPLLATSTALNMTQAERGQIAIDRQSRRSRGKSLGGAGMSKPTAPHGTTVGLGSPPRGGRGEDDTPRTSEKKKKKKKEKEKEKRNSM